MNYAIIWIALIIVVAWLGIQGLIVRIAPGEEVQHVLVERVFHGCASPV